VVTLSASSGLTQSKAAAGFEKLKSLVGEWQGRFQWSGGRSDAGEMNATYYLTGNGSAVVENLTIPDSSVVIMTSVYHLDGDFLRMTHYCAAGNQPRLKAIATDERGAVVDFELVDVTNLARPNTGHVHKVRLEFKDIDHLRILFTFLRDGRESLETVTLERVR
jgi:hypothetical protein